MKYLKSNEKKAVGKLVSGLKKMFGDKIEEIRIYGSKARGDYEEFSDIDIFILTTGDEKEINSYLDETVYKIDLTYDVVISTITYEKKEFMRPEIRNTPFIRNVLKEGIVL